MVGYSYQNHYCFLKGREREREREREVNLSGILPSCDNCVSWPKSYTQYKIGWKIFEQKVNEIMAYERSTKQRQTEKNKGK